MGGLGWPWSRGARPFLVKKHRVIHVSCVASELVVENLQNIKLPPKSRWLCCPPGNRSPGVAALLIASKLGKGNAHPIVWIWVAREVCESLLLAELAAVTNWHGGKAVKM